MHEPDGYPPANDHVIAAAAASDGPARRVLPRRPARRSRRRDPPLRRRGRARRSSCTRAPSASTSTSPACARSSPRRTTARLPILIHAGRGIPALGAHVLELAGEFPRARFILAHAGVCDLAWLWRRVDEYPNVFFDTAWFSVPDLLALFAHVAPGQILYATDIPFGSPVHGEPADVSLRAAGRADAPSRSASSPAASSSGSSPGEDALDVGPAPGPNACAPTRCSHRVELLPGAARSRRRIGGGDTTQYVDLARLACLVGDDAPQAPICRSVLELLELHRGSRAAGRCPSASAHPRARHRAGARVHAGRSCREARYDPWPGSSGSVEPSLDLSSPLVALAAISTQPCCRRSASRRDARARARVRIASIAARRRRRSPTVAWLCVNPR